MWRLWLRMLMHGRYGFDALGRFLLIIGLALHLLAILLRQGSWVLVLQILGFSFVLLALLRIMSRNIGMREKEAQRFALTVQRYKNHWAGFKRAVPRILNGEFFVERRFYKFLRCPRCNAKLRLPRGKGKVVVTCPRCKHKTESIS